MFSCLLIVILVTAYGNVVDTADLVENPNVEVISTTIDTAPTEIKHFCESTEAVIQCPGKTTIQIIEGHFGRRNLEICTDVHDSELTKFACSVEITSYLNDLCSNKITCSFTVKGYLLNVVDPCTNTHKYAVVVYQCLGVPTTTLDTTTTTTTLDTTKMPTTIMDTTKMPTTIMDTTKMPITIMDTTKMPTTIIDTATMPTTVLATTIMPTTTLVTMTKPTTTTIGTTTMSTPSLDITTMPTTTLDTTTMPTTTLDTSTMLTTTLDTSTMLTTTQDTTTLLKTTLDTTTMPTVLDTTTMAASITLDVTTVSKTATSDTTKLPTTAILILDTTKMSTTSFDNTKTPLTNSETVTIPKGILDATSTTTRTAYITTMASTTSNNSKIKRPTSDTATSTDKKLLSTLKMKTTEIHDSSLYSTKVPPNDLNASKIPDATSATSFLITSDPIKPLVSISSINETTSKIDLRTASTTNMFVNELSTNPTSLIEANSSSVITTTLKAKPIEDFLIDFNDTSVWNIWGECDVECGIGKRYRSRGFTTLNQSNELFETERIEESCHMLPCPVHGGWGEWMYIEPTSIKKCGVTKSSKYRECDNPVASYGGHECLGSKYYDVIHESFDCQVDGKWSEWSEFTHCDAPCGGGNMYRQRHCTNSDPNFGGKTCVGESIEHQKCNEIPCQDNVSANFQVELMDKNMYTIDPRIVAAKLKRRIENLYTASDKHSSKIKDIIIHSVKIGNDVDIPERQDKRIDNIT